VLQRFFTVAAKGIRGKNKKQPFVKLQTDEGDTLMLVLATKEDLAGFEIGQELPVTIGEGKSPQTRLQQ